MLLAKSAVCWGRSIDGGWWAPLALVWQDVAFALGFGLLDRLVNRPRIGWSLYALIALYVTVNVPIARALSSPLTWPMLRATDPTLGDSIAHYATWTNLLLIGWLLVATAVLPLIVRRFWPRRPSWLILIGFAVVAVGPFAACRVDTAGLDRNVLVALVTTALPRVAAQRHDGNDWRRSPFEPSPVDDLRELKSAASGSNVLLVVLESAAALYLRIYGAQEDPMPNLTRLAGRGVTFENTYVVYPESIKGLYALLFSKCPAFDTAPDDYDALDAPALPAVLRTAGYGTALFHSGRFAYLGMDVIVRQGGFETCEDASQIGGHSESSFGVDEEATVERIFEWIDQPAGDRPFFIAYLPVAGHHPYDTPQRGPFPEEAEIGRYRNALHYADQALGKLIAGLQRRGLDRNTVVVVVGDHGQAFNQHPGNYGHTLFLYEENVHVPLVMAVPAQREANKSREAKKSRTIASTIDIGPTLLDLLGLNIPPAYDGQSLLSPQPKMALFFTDYSLPLVGLRDDRWKFIDQLGGGRAKLFDLSRDCGEAVNLASQHADRASAYRIRLQQWAEAERDRMAAAP